MRIRVEKSMRGTASMTPSTVEILTTSSRRMLRVDEAERCERTRIDANRCDFVCSSNSEDPVASIRVPLPGVRGQDMHSDISSRCSLPRNSAYSPSARRAADAGLGAAA
jgi:hypothetical protein